MGWNLTVMVQLAPGLRLLGQLFVCLNALVTLMWLIFRTPAPELVSVTCCAGLVVKTTWFGNVRLVGENVTAGGVPKILLGRRCRLRVGVAACHNEP